MATRTPTIPAMSAASQDGEPPSQRPRWLRGRHHPVLHHHCRHCIHAKKGSQRLDLSLHVGLAWLALPRKVRMLCVSRLQCAPSVQTQVKNTEAGSGEARLSLLWDSNRT
jgi:hypothetical protein